MSTTAERLARHLETNYGLQLDDYRLRALVEEIDLFFPVPCEPVGVLSSLAPATSVVEKDRQAVREIADAITAAASKQTRKPRAKSAPKQEKR